MKKFFYQKIKTSTLLYSLVIFTFFFVLVIFLIAGIAAPDKKYSESENRNLTAFPEVTVENIFSGNFMTKFESYLSDQFINRDIIVSLKTSFSRSLGNTEVNGVYIGKNDRLYEVPSDFDDRRITETIDSIMRFAKNSNIENKYFILVPNSTHIIPENLPVLLKCENQSQQISDIYSQLEASFTCIDAVSPLLDAQNRESLYLRTDHHWTADAAKIVFDNFALHADINNDKTTYNTISLSTKFRGTLASSSGVDVAPDTLTAIVPDGIEGSFVVHNFDKQEKKTTFFDSEKLDTKNQYEVFFGGNFSRIRIFTDNVNGRNLIVFKDSYANCFIPLLIPYYENIIIIDPRYFSENIDDVLLDYQFTDMLFLYNLNTFAEDTSISSVIK